MGSILDRAGIEIEGQSDDSLFHLSNNLIGRIVALSNALLPYHFLENDKRSLKYVSPERGQLLYATMANNLDSFTQNSIVQKGNFNHSLARTINLNNGKLMYARFQNSNFYRASFKNANLTNASFKNTLLSWTNFENANLKSANLDKIWMIDAILGKAKMKDATIQNAYIERVKMDSATINYANFSYSTLCATTFLGAKCIGTIFFQTDLEDSSLQGADLSYANFKEAKNLSVDSLIKAKSLYESTLSDSLKTLLKKRRECLFKKDGCN